MRETIPQANDMTGSVGSAAMLAQQVTVAHAVNLADAIPREGLDSNKLNVTAILSATLSPGTACWYESGPGLD